MRRGSLWLFALFLSIAVLCSSVLSVSAKLVNVTVDDAGVDPVTGLDIQFLPLDRWNEVIGGCTSCSAKADPSQANNMTWHDTTYDPNSTLENELQTATFRFNGEPSTTGNIAVATG